MVDFTFLSEDEIVGRNKLDIFKKRDVKAAITDFSVLSGGYVSNWTIDGSNDLVKRTGYYWTRTDDGYDDVCVVSRFGCCRNYDVYSRDVGARPAFLFSQISDIPTNGVGRRASDGVLEIEYGYYPKQAVGEIYQIYLESVFQAGQLQRLKDTIATDSCKPNDYGEKFSCNLLDVYDYLGKKYVRVKANFCKPTVLSNGITYKTGDYVWVEVKPVTWWVDEKAKKVICENIVFAGVQFNNVSNYKGDLLNTDIKKFMDEYFAKDLVQSFSMTQDATLNKSIEEETISSKRVKVYVRKRNGSKIGVTLTKKDEA